VIYPLAWLIWWLAQAGLGIDATGFLARLWGAMPVVFLVHWWLSLKRVYQLGWFRAFLAAFAFLLATVVSHFVFRLIQFLAVFAAS